MFVEKLQYIQMFVKHRFYVFCFLDKINFFRIYFKTVFQIFKENLSFWYKVLTWV